MKRIKAACICQTLHFMLKDGAEPQWARDQVKQYNTAPVGNYLT